MPNPYDKALRERVVTAYESGAGSALGVATTFGVSHRTSYIMSTASEILVPGEAVVLEPEGNGHA